MSHFTVIHIYLTTIFVIYGDICNFRKGRKWQRNEARLWCDRTKWGEIRAEKIWVTASDTRDTHIDTHRHDWKLEMIHYVPKSNSVGIKTVYKRLIDLSTERDSAHSFHNAPVWGLRRTLSMVPDALKSASCLNKANCPRKSI